MVCWITIFRKGVRNWRVRCTGGRLRERSSRYLHNRCPDSGLLFSFLSGKCRQTDPSGSTLRHSRFICQQIKRARDASSGVAWLTRPRNFVGCLMPRPLFAPPPLPKARCMELITIVTPIRNYKFLWQHQMTKTNSRVVCVGLQSEGVCVCVCVLRCLVGTTEWYSDEDIHLRTEQPPFFAGGGQVLKTGGGSVLLHRTPNFLGMLQTDLDLAVQILRSRQQKRLAFFWQINSHFKIKICQCTWNCTDLEI